MTISNDALVRETLFITYHNGDHHFRSRESPDAAVSVFPANASAAPHRDARARRGRDQDSVLLAKRASTMSAVSALRARVRLARPLSSATARRFAERSLFSASAPSGPAGRAPQTRPPAFRATATQRAARSASARETRGVTCAAGGRADGRLRRGRAREPRRTDGHGNARVFLLGRRRRRRSLRRRGSSGHDVVRDARDVRGDTEGRKPTNRMSPGGTPSPRLSCRARTSKARSGTASSTPPRRATASARAS